MAGSCGKSMFSFVTTTTTNTAKLPSKVSCIVLQSHQPWMRVPVALHLVLSVFCVLTVLMGV